MLEKRQLAGREINRENRNRIMTSIRDIEVFFCYWMEEKFGAGVRSREAAWKSRNSLHGTKRWKVIVDRHRGFEFIQDEDELIIGIENKMSRTVAQFRHSGRRYSQQCTICRNESIGVDLICTEIGTQGILLDTIEKNTVSIRSTLTVGIDGRTGVPIEASERSETTIVGIDGKNRHGAIIVIRDEDMAACSVR